MLMLVLIVAVAACLAVGLVLGKMLLVWCALGASVLGMLPLGYLLCAARRSSRATRATAAEIPAEISAEVPRESEAEDAPETLEEPTAPTEPNAATPEPVEAGADRADLAGPDRIVHVVPGRRR